MNTSCTVLIQPGYWYSSHMKQKILDTHIDLKSRYVCMCACSLAMSTPHAYRSATFCHPVSYTLRQLCGCELISSGFASIVPCSISCLSFSVQILIVQYSKWQNQRTDYTPTAMKNESHSDQLTSKFIYYCPARKRTQGHTPSKLASTNLHMAFIHTKFLHTKIWPNLTQFENPQHFKFWTMNSWAH